MESVEKTGETIEAAVEAGLKELGVSAADVMVEVLEEPSRGVLGIGARPARVRIIFMGRRPEPTPDPYEDFDDEPQILPTSNRSMLERNREESVGIIRVRPERNERPRRERGERAERGGRGRGRQRGAARAERPPARYDEYDVAFEDPEDMDFSPKADIIPDEQADEMAVVGKKVLMELLAKMEIEATVTIHKSESTREGEETLWILNISGQNVTGLIGRRGDTLASLQYILRLMLSRQVQKRANIIVDVAEYKLRRTDRLRQLATRMADQAIKQGRTVTLEPMPPNERRIIHLTLKERADVETKSIGEGAARKVTINPVQP
jgi:spoIIIJ-associated protein